MADPVTLSLLTTVLGSSSIRRLFTTIANQRIAEVDKLRGDQTLHSGNIEAELGSLESAGLIGAGSDGKKYYVTADGLKVARDLGKFSAG